MTDSRLPQPTPHKDDSQLDEILDLLEEHGERVSVTAAEYNKSELSEKELGEHQLANYKVTAGNIQALIAKAAQEARIDENSTIHQWVQKPDKYDELNVMEQLEWVMMTLGKIGSYLDARQVELAALQANKETNDE